jgi:LmbE family N-acetylglucosaminyl deacetylase
MGSQDRVLVFSPHPDDLELFCGGTILRHLSEGAAVKMILMTYGERGSLRSLLGATRREAVKNERISEINRRLQLAPALEHECLGLPDRHVPKTEETIVQVLGALERFKPTCIYLPESVQSSSFYYHPDHFATAQIVEAAVARCTNKAVLRYFHSKNPNIWINMSDFHQENLTALRCYTSQYRFFTGVPFLLHLYGAVRYTQTRRNGKKLGVRFAESFREAR